MKKKFIRFVLSEDDTDLIGWKNSLPPRSFTETVNKILVSESIGQIARIPYEFSSSEVADKVKTGFCVADENVLALLGGSAATQGMLDAAARGATDGQALAVGLTNGVFEFLFEKFEIEGLLDAISGGTFQNIARQALTEGFGEAATSFSNTMADIFLMAEKSNWSQNVNRYLEADPTMRPEEAQLNAFRDTAVQIGKDAIGGMLLGGVMTAGGIGINKAASAAGNAHRNYQTGKVIAGKQGGVDSLKAIAGELSEVAEDGTKAQIEKLSSKVTDKKGIAHIANQANVGKLFSAVTNAATEKSSTDIAKSLERKGYATDEANSIAEAISAAISGKGLTSEQTATFKSAIDDERVQQALKDIVLNKKSTTNQTRQKVKQFAKETGLVETGYRALENRVDKLYDTSKEGKTVLHSTGEEVSISEVVSLDGGKMSVRLDNGQVVDASDIDFANDSQSYLYSAVSKIENISPQAATAIISGYDPASGQKVGEYLNGVDEAYTYGFHGYTKADLMAGDYTGKLTDVQRNSAYYMGQEERKLTDDAKVETHKKMRTAAEAKRAEKKAATAEKSSAVEKSDSNDAEVYFQDGKTVTKFDEHTGKYDEKRMAAVNYAKFLSKLGIGGKYFFYESYVKDGKRYYKDANGKEVEAPNGMYESDGSIHIDLNAGDYGQGTTLFTLGHELTHFIKEWSPEKFKVLADFLIEEYGKTDMTMHERVLAKQNRLTEIRGKRVSYNEAFEEVVADAMSTMLTDGNLHEKLIKLKAKDKGLVAKIKEFFDELVAKFRGVYAELTPEQKDARDVRAMKDAFDKIQTAFAEALVEASENFQASEGQKNTTEDGGVDVDYDIKLSPREENAFKPFARIINSVINRAITGKGYIDGKIQVQEIMPVGPKLAAMVAASSENAIDISKKSIALNSGEIWHEYKRHTQVNQEISRGQIAFTKRQFQNAVKCIVNPDMVETIFSSTNNPTQNQSFAYVKKTSRGHYVVVEAVGGKRSPYIYPVMILQFSKSKWNKMISQGKTLGELLLEGDTKKLQALDIEQNKKSRVSAAQFASYEAIANTLRSSQLNTKISQPDAEVNSKSAVRNSDRDSQGNKLSKEQKVKDTEVAKQMPKVIERITDEIVKPEKDGVKNSNRYSGLTPSKYNALLTKKPISASKKDWAKVNEARMRQYARMEDSDIPDLDIFRLAEYGKVNEGYLYFVRNYGKDYFAIVGKKQIIPAKRDVIREEQIAYEESNSRKETRQNDDRNGTRRGIDARGSERSGNGSELQENDVGAGRDEKTVQDSDSWNGTADSRFGIKRSERDSTGNQLTEEQVEFFKDSDGVKNGNRSDVVRFSQRNFNKAVDDIVYSDDNVPFEYQNVYMGVTPKSLLDIGFIQLPMTITSKHIYTIANKDGRFSSPNDHYHELGATMVKELPNMVKESVVTFVEKDNPRRVIIVTSKVDPYGQPIMVAVEYSGQTEFDTASNKVLIYANPVTTALGKKANWFASQIEDAIRDGRMLQADKKRSQESPSGLWAQCPESLWSSDFTTNIEQFKQNVKRFLPKDKQIHKAWNAVRESEEKTKKSERGDGTSNRDLLANAFEGITQNSEEYKLIQEYKGRIRLINEYEEKLAKLNAEIRQIRFGTKGKRDMERLTELERKAKQVASNINRNDKKLLSLEASEPLRKVLERERKKEAQKTREHVNKIKENRKIKAEQTELRHKIRKAIRDLDKLLNRGDKKRNVKEDMKGFVSKALQSAEILFLDTYDSYDMLRNGIGTQLDGTEKVLVATCTRMLKDLDKMTTGGYENWQARQEVENRLKTKMSKLKSVFARERSRLNETRVSAVLGELADAYAQLEDSQQSYVQGAYSEAVHNYLKSLQGEVGGTIVKDMTKSQLESVYAAYKMVLTTVRKANELFVKGKSASIDQMAEQIARDFAQRKTPDKKLATVVRNLSNKIGWDYEKLYYALDRIGSEAFTELVMNVANSEDITMQDVLEAVTFRDEIVEKYGFNDWKVNKEIDREFLDNTGKKFKLTLGQLMALYAYSRRKGAWDHIEYGGFVFGQAALTNPKPADSYKLTKEQCEAITDLLTAEQKGYVEEMQKFLSEVMGSKGNEVSMLLYGIEMFGEENYFPIHIAGQFMVNANESQAKAAEGFTSMTNAGFTHAQNPKAKAPFVLEGFNEIWADHVNEMSRYHGTVPALEDMRRVMNRSTYFESSADSVAIKQLMENAYGKEAVDYFNNLYREANSGAIRDKLEKKSRKFLGLFRKNSVAYSLSVLIQQPASVVRAYAMIDRKYFGFKGVGVLSLGVAKLVGNKWTKAHTKAYNEMLKYAPGVTMAKEIGGFDTHTGESIRSYLLDTGKSFKQGMKTENLLGKGKAILNKVDNNAVANLPNLADKIAWIEIWNACKREVMTKRGHEFFSDGGVEYAKGKKRLEKAKAVQYSERGDLNTSYDAVKQKYGLTDGELHSLIRYKSSESYKINAMLRDGVRLEELGAEERAFVRDLDSALAKLPKHRGPVYRNLSFDDFGGKEAFDKFVAEHSETGIVTYDDYTSASAKEDGYPVEGKYVIHLIIPESVHAYDMTGIGNNFESEVIYERGSVFTVDHIAIDGEKKVTIYLREVTANERSNPVDQADVQGRNGKATQPLQKNRGIGKREHEKLYSEERSVAVPMQEPQSGYSDLQGVSKRNTEGNPVRGVLQGEDSPRAAEVSVAQTELAGEEAFLTAVGKRFTEVIRATQVYDSMFAKSPMLKSKSLAVQYLVSFMNEPNTVANMAEKAVRDMVRGNWKEGAKEVQVVLHSIIFTNVLKSVIYAMRDDDEDETYVEKYLEAFAGNLIADFAPQNYIPLARDVWAIWQGHDVERPDMAVIQDAISTVNAAWQNAFKDTENMTEEQLVEFDKKVIEANWKLVESLAACFGIPVKNIRREIVGLLDQLSGNAGQTTPLSAWDKIRETVLDSNPFTQEKVTKNDKLYGALMTGDGEYLDRLKATSKSEAAYESAVIKALRENDPRIHAAAHAGFEGNSEERKRIFHEIKAEGRVSGPLLIDAINSELNAIRNAAEPERATSQYDTDGFVEAVADGNLTDAQAIMDDIISTHVTNGKTQTEAARAFQSDMKSSIRTAYSYGSLTRAEAEKMLSEYADMKNDKVADKIAYWDFCEAHPGCDLNESKVGDYLEFAEPADIPLEAFERFVAETKHLADIKDEWGNVELSKRDQVLTVIDSLPLTWEQKDALYLAAGYAESKIWDVPW